MSKKNIDYKSDKTILDIYDCAMNISRHGIAVPSKNMWGWSWIDFTYIQNADDDNILNHEFNSSEINDGMSESDELYEGLTLKNILQLTEGKFRFGINTDINWDEDDI